MSSQTEDCILTLTRIIENGDVIYAYNVIYAWCISSLQPQKVRPKSDELLLAIFGKQRQLEVLTHYLDTLGKVSNFIKLNPSLLEHINVARFNIVLSRFKDMIKLEPTDEEIIKKIKCFLLAIKSIPKLDKQSLRNPKNKDKLDQVLDEIKLLCCIDEQKYAELILKYPALVPEPEPDVVKVGRVRNNPITLEAVCLSDPHYKAKFYNSDGKNQVCPFLTTDFREILMHILDHSTDHFIQFIKLPRRRTSLRDFIGPGYIESGEYRIILIIEQCLTNGTYVQIQSDKLLTHITDNAVSRKDKIAKYNFVQDMIRRIPAILLDENYRFEFEERNEEFAFTFYKKVCSMIYKLLRESDLFGCVYCNDCKLYTTANTTDIKCSQCNISYCRKCSKKSHPFAECEETILSTDKEKLDELISFCPTCNTPCERTEKCVHMRAHGRCKTEFCDLCGCIWPTTEQYDHIWNYSCRALRNIHRIGEYMPILRHDSSIINISKAQVRLLQKRPKLVDYLIKIKQSIMNYGDTSEKLDALKQDPRFIEASNRDSSKASGGSASDSDSSMAGDRDSRMASGGSAGDRDSRMTSGGSAGDRDSSMASGSSASDRNSSMASGGSAGDRDSEMAYRNEWNINYLPLSIIGSTYKQATNNGEIAREIQNIQIRNGGYGRGHGRGHGGRGRGRGHGGRGRGGGPE